MKIKKMTISEKYDELKKRTDAFYKNNPDIERPKEPSSKPEDFNQKIKKIAEKMRNKP